MTYLIGHANKTRVQRDAIETDARARIAAYRLAGKPCRVTSTVNTLRGNTYRGFAHPDYTDELIAWACDDPCFGAVVERDPEGNFVVTVYTD